MPNGQFHGLSWSQAQALDHYFHLRAPETPTRARLVDADGLVKPDAFLDPVSEDLEGKMFCKRLHFTCDRRLVDDTKGREPSNDDLAQLVLPRRV